MLTHAPAFACTCARAGASDTRSLPAGADAAPNKALIGAATGSCVAIALVALVLYVWHRHRTALVACILGPKGHMWGAAGRQPGSHTSKQAASFMLPPLAVRAGSLPLRVRALAHIFVYKELMKFALQLSFRPHSQIAENHPHPVPESLEQSQQRC